LNTIKKEEFERLVIENQLSMYRLAMSILKNSNDAEDAVSEAVLTLNAKYAKVVILYYYEGFSTREIARILHIPEGTVKSRLSRARSKLQQII